MEDIRIRLTINAGILLLKNLERQRWLALGIHLPAFTKVITELEYLYIKDQFDGPGIILEGNYSFVNVFGTIGFCKYEYKFTGDNLEVRNEVGVCIGLGVGVTF